jgi:hypothetical protein
MAGADPALSAPASPGLFFHRVSSRAGPKNIIF